MNKPPELGGKRNRNCVSPAQVLEEEAAGASMCESINGNGNCSNSNLTNLVWQQWTATFRASRRLKNDLLVEEAIDANVERHMSLGTSKKRSHCDESDSDDECNYYQLDVPPPQQPRRHPSEFTPSGFLPRLGPQQVTPASYDVDALPVCSLRRYGHDDEGFGCYDMDDRIPPPPSFRLAEGMPAPRFSIGSMAPTEQKEESIVSAPTPPSMVCGVVLPGFAVGLGRTTKKSEEVQTASPPPPSPTLRRRGGCSRFSNGMGTVAEERDSTSEMQRPAFAGSALRQLLAQPKVFCNKSEHEVGSLEQDSPAPLPPLLTPVANSKRSVLDKMKRPNAAIATMPPPPQVLPPAAAKSILPKITKSISQEDRSALSSRG